jgi:putative hydrolase of the HAD superfamily
VEPSVIDTFLFDMGNVLVHFSHPQMCRQIAELCGCSAEAIRALLFDEGWEGELERGEISEIRFLERLQGHFQRPLNLESLIRAGSDIFTLNAPMLPILQALKRQGKRLVLLSNTSVSHINFVRREFPVLQYFDDMVLSCEVGAMKPDAAIFQAAVGKIECPPERCFYTDDIEAYVMIGRQHGLQAEVFTTAAALVEQLARRGIQF